MPSLPCSTLPRLETLVLISRWQSNVPPGDVGPGVSGSAVMFDIATSAAAFSLLQESRSLVLQARDLSGSQLAQLRAAVGPRIRLEYRR